MTVLFRFYRHVNILSLDVVAGAVVGALFFGRVFDVRILSHGLAALALTVWIIYTADHLRDAKKIRHKASSPRHAFHQKHFQTLAVLCILACITDVVFLFFIRPQVLVAGICVSALVGLYLLLHRTFFFLKEVFVAGLYTLGVLLPSLFVSSGNLTVLEGILICDYFLIALLNLLIFSYFDEHADLHDKLGSFVTKFGSKHTLKVIRLLFGFVFLLTIAGSFIVIDATLLVPVLMALVLLCTLTWPNYFRQHERYRIAGDAIFFLPLLYIL
jgi:4-hydroxybenzoate polyprenyltransferase